jgi:transposase-like protein
MSVLDKNIFGDDAAAYAFLEGIVWPNGPVCPHCGATDRINRLEGVRSKPSKKNPEGVARHGLWKCYHCRKQFTVTVKTVFESSHIPLHKWLQAAFLLCSSKKGISAHQLHRVLQIAYNSAWFMAHRLREAMRVGDLSPMGGMARRLRWTKPTSARKSTAPSGRTSAAPVRGEAHTNTIEGVFSIFKRGMKGIYQHCGEQHLHRYLAEFDFRYNARRVTDSERTMAALGGIKGKRLTYRNPYEKTA